MALLGYPEILLAVIFFIILGRFWNINDLPWNWPLLGMFPSVFLHLHRIHDRVTDILEKSGCTFLVKGPWFCNMDLLVTTDPANVHYIMSSHFSNFPKGSEKLGLLPILDYLSEQEDRAMDLQDVFQRLTFDTTCMIKHEPSYKFFAFNAGPRTCLGKEVAFTQMKAVAATIIHNYHVQVVEENFLQFSIVSLKLFSLQIILNKFFLYDCFKIIYIYIFHIFLEILIK
ncbi:unnamed protein product, partial [Vitis vinifera]